MGVPLVDKLSVAANKFLLEPPLLKIELLQPFANNLSFGCGIPTWTTETLLTHLASDGR